MPINNEKSDSVKECPLSFSQHRIWILQNLYNDVVMYNTSRCFRIKGPLDTEALQKTVDALVSRHETLRARLQIARDGSPFQIMEKEPDLKIEQTDLRNTSGKDIRRLAGQIIQEAVVRPFNIYNELMLRVVSVRLSETENILLFVKHHLITDYSSWRLFLEEFEKIYTSIIMNHPISLPPLELTYSDFVKKQELLFKKDHMEKMQKYWSIFFEEHHDLEPPVDISFKKLRNNKIPSYDSLRQFIPSQVITECKKIAQSQKCTLFIIVLTSISLLASYLYRTSKVLLCFANANRKLPGTEKLIGCFFTNTILSMNILPKRKLFELINDVRQIVMNSWQNQVIPFEMFAEDLSMECTKQRKPPYRIYISYRKSANDTEFSLPGTQSQPIDVLTGRNTHEDIVFNIWERLSEGKFSLEIEWLWKTDRFDQQTIKKTSEILEAVLSQMNKNIHADMQSLQDQFDIERIGA